MAFARTSLWLGLIAAPAALLLPQVQAQTVPTDPQPVCAIAPATFAAMFESGNVTLNGVVKPADSTVNLAPNCPFFVWSEQMFLWVTSPSPSRYGGGEKRIMFSPAFYTVSPSFDTGEAERRRDFLPNKVGFPLNLLLRATELGPHLKPVVMSRTGQVVEVERPVPGRPVPAIVRLQNGANVELKDVRRSPTGGLRFFDTRGVEVQVRKLQLPMVVRPRVQMPDGQLRPLVPSAAMTTAIQAHKFVIKGIPVFVDANNNVIDVEAGQADGGVLISQNNSLIFYIGTVNDMYAYHRTMQGAAIVPFGTNLKFPLTAADASAVQTFSSSHGHTLVDPQALAIETKSSWVEASAVPNPQDYVQVNAVIPTFDKSNPNVWTPNGQKTVKMVMVGVHVVGSTAGHGEMVWASFEHVGNAPNAQYKYTSTTGLKTVNQNTVGNWLFTPSGSAGPFNGAKASWDETTGNITGTPVGVTPVLRVNPWGMPGSSTSFNTQVISANASVIAQLAPGDVRRNYFQVGTTWTIGGAAPNGGNEVGTNQLANSTIETFVQGSNCFACHGTNKVAVSHYYRVMKPLF